MTEHGHFLHSVQQSLTENKLLATVYYGYLQSEQGHRSQGWVS